MGEGFIVRKGGAIVTKAPSINIIDVFSTNIVFTITNNDTTTADIFWEVGDSTPDANTFSLAGGATSSNQVASGLTPETQHTIFAFANVEGKAGSQTTSKVRTTSIQAEYIVGTGGTTFEYDSGGKRYRSHTFLENETFTINELSGTDETRNQIDYLIIAGGAAGGATSAATTGGGGGGAGGFRSTVTPTPSNVTPDAKITAVLGTFNVIVGAGGSGNSGNGSDSIVEFPSNIISTGGGGGALSGGGKPGGSGGGGAGGASTSNGGVGISGQGRNGGTGVGGAGGTNRAGGGGGGAGGVGQNGIGGTGGAGGNGLANLLRTGLNETRSLGGRGSNGGSSITQVSGESNTGNGGTGNRGNGTPGQGGSGIVIIRYEIAPSV